MKEGFQNWKCRWTVLPSREETSGLAVVINWVSCFSLSKSFVQQGNMLVIVLLCVVFPREPREFPRFGASVVLCFKKTISRQKNLLFSFTSLWKSKVREVISWHSWDFGRPSHRKPRDCGTWCTCGREEDNKCWRRRGSMMLLSFY